MVLIKNNIDEYKEEIILLCYENICTFTKFGEQKIFKLIESNGIHTLLIKSKIFKYTQTDPNQLNFHEKLSEFRVKITANLLSQPDSKVKVYIESLGVVDFLDKMLNVYRTNKEIVKYCLLGFRNIASSRYKNLLLENESLFEKDMVDVYYCNSGRSKVLYLKIIYYLIY